MEIFLLFFWSFLLCVGLERNGTIIFIFSLSRTFPAYFGLKCIHNGIFEFFCYFFDIFYYASGWSRTERQFLSSLFLVLFRPIMAWNESIMVFFNFFCYIFSIFLEFSIMRRVGTGWNDNFYFLPFSDFISFTSFSNWFSPEMLQYW